MDIANFLRQILLLPTNRYEQGQRQLVRAEGAKEEGHIINQTLVADTVLDVVGECAPVHIRWLEDVPARLEGDVVVDIEAILRLGERHSFEFSNLLFLLTFNALVVSC